MIDVNLFVHIICTHTCIPSYEPVWVHNIIYMYFMYERHNNTTCTFTFVFGYIMLIFLHPLHKACT